MVKDDTKLTFLGFGTMNGKDGKPFKTREGGVMRLENLIRDINEEMYKKIVDNRSIKEEDARATAKIVGLSAIKYGDLHLLKEIPVRIFCIQPFVSNLS